MKKQSRILKNGSKPAVSSQLKTTQSRGLVRPASALPMIALFPEGDGETSGGISSELVDLSQAEYAALKRAAAPTGSGVLMFMANTALEKIGAAPQTPSANHPSCLCLYDSGVGELAGKISLVGHELPFVVIAAHRQRTSVDQFIADAIRAKLGRAHPNASTSESVQIAVEVLVNLAVRKVHDCPIDEQICVWNALSKLLPDSAAREHAGNIALLQSKVAARQLQFADTLSSQAPQPSHQRRAA